ncbi:hypothetical protein LCGC14_1498490 [marine sediment metagenome]|uniref:Nuclease associated modular domain-containing protein n=1 Tax=marine sediment metagenome TaxID=412755 RepID=A0A0F9M677_9ZZZZ
MIFHKCIKCGKEFKIKPYKIKLGQGKYCSRKCLYTRKGERHPLFGIPRSKEIKRKISEKLTGRKHTSESKMKMSEALTGENHPLFGKHRSMETRRKISEGHKGIKPSIESKRKNSEAHKGKIMAEETKKKISEANKGEKCYRWKGGIKATRKRRKRDLKYQLNSRISRSINLCLKKGIKSGRHWGDLIGYNIEDLKKRLDSTMPEGYNWDDLFIGKLHIDHKIPISAFNFDKPEHIDFKRCWALENLQLLPAQENRKKHDKLLDVFQTCLKI